MSTYDILKTNFDAAYAGNRAPFPIYIHVSAAWGSSQVAWITVQAVVGAWWLEASSKHTPLSGPSLAAADALAAHPSV